MSRVRPVMTYAFTECTPSQLAEHKRTHVVRASVKRSSGSRPPKRMLETRGKPRNKSSKSKYVRTAAEAERMLSSALLAAGV